MDFNFLDQQNQHLPLQIPYGMPPSTNSQTNAYHEMPLENPTVDLVYPVTIGSTAAEYAPRPIALPQAVPPDRTAVFSTRIDLVNPGNLQVTQSSGSGVSQQVQHRGHSFHIPAFATTTHPDLNLTNTIRTSTQCNSASGHRVEVPSIDALSKPGPRPERDVIPNSCPPRSEREVDNSISLQNKQQVQSTGPTELSSSKTSLKRLAPSGQSEDVSRDHAGNSQPFLYNHALATSILMEGGVLPEGLAYKQFDNDIKCVGVIAQKTIKKGTRYGPFKGDIRKGDSSESGHSNRQTWELCIDGAVVAYIGPMFSKKEWMGLVRYACCLEEWNLEAEQLYGRIYFTVKVDIEPGTELRVFYSDEYRENCGLQFGLADLQFSNKTEDFGCFWCDGRYSCPKSVSRHMKFIHNEKKSKDKIPPIVLPDKEAEMIKQITWGDKKARKSNFRAATVETKSRLGNENHKEMSSKKKLPVETPAVTRIAATEELDNEQRFICTTCGKHFPSHGRLLIHESFHNDDADQPSSDQCHICGFYFAEFNLLEAHLEKHKTSPFWCDECGRLYTQRSLVFRHKREKHGIDDLRHNDGKRFRKEAANSIVLGASASRKYVLKANKRRCKVCGYVTSSLFEHGEHTAKHDKFSVGCNICGNVYMAMRQVYRHKREKHGFPKLVNQPPRKRSLYPSVQHCPSQCCQHCGYKCPTSDALDMHTQQHAMAPFGCRYCGQVFVSEEDCWAHMREEHMSEDQALQTTRRLTVSLPGYAKINGDVCLKCGYRCTNNAVLADHVARHLTHPYGCGNCGNVYVQRKNLVRHKREKHGQVQTEDIESPEYLERVIADGAECKDGQGMAPWSCDRCGNMYAQKKDLYRHIRVKHSATYRPMPRGARVKMKARCFDESEPHTAVRPFHNTLSASHSLSISKMENSEESPAAPLPSTRKVLKKIGKNCVKTTPNHTLLEETPVQKCHGETCCDTSSIQQKTVKHSSHSILSKKSVKIFPKKSAFPKHFKRPLWRKHFKCWLCQRQFPCASQLKAHKQQTHSLKGNHLTCQLCRKVFTTRKSLVMHQRHHHKKKKRLVCDKKMDSITERRITVDSRGVSDTPERAVPQT